MCVDQLDHWVDTLPSLTQGLLNLALQGDGGQVTESVTGAWG